MFIEGVSRGGGGIFMSAAAAEANMAVLLVELELQEEG